MDEQMVRKHIGEIRDRLRVIESERDVLLTLLRGYEGWLRLYANGHLTSQLPLPITAHTGRKEKRVSFRGAIRQVVEEAHGEPLHVKEIWRRVQELGAMTKSKDALAAIDFTCYSMRERMKKVAPRTWQSLDDEAATRGEGS
jgi:hypothetical protein